MYNPGGKHYACSKAIVLLGFPVYGMRVVRFAAVLFAFSLAGCGGGGNNNESATPSPSATATPLPPATPQVAVPRLVINWGKRSRAVAALTSSLSATVQLCSASADGSDITFVVARDTALDAHPQTYATPVAARVGTLDLIITFFSGPGGQGTVVG